MKNYREKNYENSQKWKKNNDKKTKKYQKKINDDHYACKLRVKRLMYKADPRKHMEQTKVLVKKRRELGNSSSCAEYKHGKCKNTRKTCKCICHKNT